MIFILFAGILLISAFFFQEIGHTDKFRKINFAFTILVFNIIFWGITETADWTNYTIIFENNEVPTDPLFRILSKLAKTNGYAFEAVYRLHIIAYSIMFCYFVMKQRVNVIFAIIGFVFLAYVPLANQIRYFLAFGFFLMGLNSWRNRKHIYLLLFFILSFLSHSGIIVLFSFIPLNSFIKKGFLKKIIFLSLPGFLIFQLPFLNLAFIEEFDLYFQQRYVSSLVGGLFSMFPYVVLIFLVHSVFQKVQKKNIPIEKDYVFLYRLSIFPIIFLPASLSLQIIGTRYILVFSLIWFIFFIYSFRFFNVPVFIKSIGLSFLFILSIFWIYFLPNFLLGQAFIFEQLKMTFSSTPLYKMFN